MTKKNQLKIANENCYGEYGGIIIIKINQWTLPCIEV